MAATAEVGPTTLESWRVRVQKFGTFLSGMIMPNIAAFIAWGFITAFFIEKYTGPLTGSVWYTAVMKSRVVHELPVAPQR